MTAVMAPLLHIPAQSPVFVSRTSGNTPSGHTYPIHEGLLETSLGWMLLSLVVDRDALFVPFGDFSVDDTPAWLASGRLDGQPADPSSAPRHEMGIEAGDVEIVPDRSGAWRKGIVCFSGRISSSFGPIGLQAIVGHPAGDIVLDGRPAHLILSAGGNGYAPKAQARRP